MLFFSRHRLPLRIFICLASILRLGYYTNAHAQTGPLRVDPALLGQTPLQPTKPTTGARRDASTDIRASDGVETRPITPATVELKPLAPPQPDRAPSAPPVVAPPPASTVSPPKPDTPAPLPTLPTTRPVSPPPSPNTSPTSTVSPRVDPTLLGIAGSGDTSLSSSGAQPPSASPAPSPSTPPLPEPFPPIAQASTAGTTDEKKSWYARLWAPVSDAYQYGNTELYLPFVTYHLRSKYSAEKIAEYQERPIGLGIGKGYYNEKGNWEGVYLVGFQDSHFKPMYMAGYGWQSTWRPAGDVRLGLGYVAGLMSRTDIMHYVPFPFVVPMGSLAYKNFSLSTAFIPGGAGWGNVAFIWAKWEFGQAGIPVGTPRKPEPTSETALATNAPIYPTRTDAIRTEATRLPPGPTLDINTAKIPTPQEATPSASPVSDDLPHFAAGTLGEPVLTASKNDQTQAPSLQLSKTLAPLSSDTQDRRPVFLAAERMGGDIEREFNAEGNAELRKIGLLATADRMTYWPIEDEIEAEGNVYLRQNQDEVRGPKMRLKVEDQIGYFDDAVYLLGRQPRAGSPAALKQLAAEQFIDRLRQEDNYWNSGFSTPQTFDPRMLSASRAIGKTMSDVRGDAKRIDFEGENQVRLKEATYSTCAPGDNGWYAKGSEFKLDYDLETGEGKHTTLYFQDIPILYSPWLPFSLNRQRRSGFLAPSANANTMTGLTVNIPYYWDIAPNMDATFTVRGMAKRGVQLNTDFRYMNQALGGLYSGETRVEYLPNDKDPQYHSRYALSWIHRQTTAYGFSSLLNYSKVSDSNYFTDFSSLVSATSQTQLLQQGLFSYNGGGWWNASANFQRYQTIQPDPKNPVIEPYRMMPQITLNARKPNLYETDMIFVGQYTAFEKPKQIINGVTLTDPDAHRFVLYPQIAFPYQTPGWYITPKLGLNFRRYNLSGQNATTPDTITSTIPTFTVDSGMTFERDSQWFGQRYFQTLEPRLYYVNIPYHDQSKIPVFDAALADFNFAQIFAENQFSGWDRINNANQLTAAVTSRLLQPNTGAEIMRFMVGQRFYFSPNKVGLGNNPVIQNNTPGWDKSDFLAAFSGQILPRLYTDISLQYNPTDQAIKRQSIGLRYLPEPGKVLNAAYRYNGDPYAYINQVDFSGQWPLTARLYGIGRINYSFHDSSNIVSTNAQEGRLIQSIAGFEYKSGCWVVRGVVQRLALTQDKASSTFFIQLELNDFASIGSNPLSILRRNIQGYRMINEPPSEYDMY